MASGPPGNNVPDNANGNTYEGVGMAVPWASVCQPSR